MDKRLVITLFGVAVLAVLALVEGLIVMFVSSMAIGVILWVFRRARARERIVAVFAAGLGGSIAAEIAYTMYRHTIATELVIEGAGGESFLMALSIGVINAVAIVIVVLFAELIMRYVERKSEQQEGSR
jgi:hypothetical protein